MNDFDKVSKKSKDEYIRIAKRLILGCEQPTDVIARLDKVKSVSYWRKLRASLKYTCWALSQKDGASLYYPKLNLLLESAMPPEIQERKKRHSKKVDLKKYPDNWQQIILKHTPKYELEILTLLLTGCRPIELSKTIIWTMGENTLSAEIKGAKVTDVAGQELRKIEINNDNEFTRVLSEKINASGGMLSITVSNYELVSDAIRATSRRVFKRLKAGHVSAYSFRHQFSANQKRYLADGEIEGDMLSKSLGHSAEKTRSRYGDARQGRKSGGQILSAVASREVKPNVKNWNRSAIRVSQKSK